MNPNKKILLIILVKIMMGSYVEVLIYKAIFLLRAFKMGKFLYGKIACMKQICLIIRV